MYIRIRGAKKESCYLEAPLFVEREVRKGKEGLGKGIQANIFRCKCCKKARCRKFSNI